METICPACKKKNVEEIECSRCGCDLEILICIANVAQERLILAKINLQQKNPEKALQYAFESWHLKNSLWAAQLAFFANIAKNDFQEALKWYPKICDSIPKET